MNENDKYLNIQDLDSLILALQDHREHYGNIPVHIDISAGENEGTFDIDAVLYSTDEDGEKSIDLIAW